MEYKIVNGTDSFKLEQIVNRFCKDGWEPLGGVVIDNTVYLQTLIRRNERQ